MYECALSTFEALTLDYVIAAYPIFLIALSYTLIELYDRDIGCLVYIWKPFYKIFSIFKRNWDIRTSVIDSFTTFFLLSYVKVLSVSGDLLMYINVYSLDGKSSARLYYDPTLHYFGEGHLPYAILAPVFLTSFVILPTVLLTLYPFQLFQNFHSVFPMRWHFLHAFIDSFQGCYKDRTEPGTADCRLFAQLGLFFRFALFVIYMLTLTSLYFTYAAIASILWLILMINVNPFKKHISFYVLIDSVFLTIISLFYILVLGENIASMEQHVYFPVLHILVTIFPFAIVLCFVHYSLLDVYTVEAYMVG